VLIAARSDDRHNGHYDPVDQFNPRDPPFEGDKRVEFWVHGNLIVRGTAEEPVTLTSDALDPHNDDWGKLLTMESSRLEITRAIIEFNRYIGVGSSDFLIQQSILRNMMGAIVIGSIGPDIDPETALELQPTLTQNYIYNTGRHAVTIRSGAPIISHNVIVARFDMDTTGWEHGAIGTDVPTCAVIHHNYLEGGPPRPYDGEIHGQYHPFTTAYGAGLQGMCLTFEYNTITGSPLALSGHAGPWSLEHNNIMPVPASGEAADYRYWPNHTSEVGCLSIGGFTKTVTIGSSRLLNRWAGFQR
jgi:hypothetical protein